MMVRDCIGNMWGWDGGSQAILFDGFGWKEGFRVMAMVRDLSGIYFQSYEIKSPPWTILWFRILGIFSGEYIKRLCLFMFKTCSNSQLLRRVL